MSEEQDPAPSSLNDETCSLSSTTTENSSEPQQESSKPSHLVLKTWDFDGLKIEFIYKDKTALKQQETSEDCEDDGDDASTVVLDDTETAEDRLKSLSEAGETSLFDEATTNNIKLERIEEEMQVNEDAEENFEGAAGLWAQDYQLPCFKTPQVEQNQYQRSSWDFLGFEVAPENVQVVQHSSICLDVNDLIKLNDEPLTFTRDRADCGICIRPLEVGRGVLLKDCLHTFCRRCLVHAIENNKTAVMMCPVKLLRCESEVRDEEIKALLSPEAYEDYIHQQLMKLDAYDLAELHENYEFVENKRDFRCEICLKDIKPGDGIVLKDCLHQYCKPCLAIYIQASETVEIKCPFRAEDHVACVGVVMDSELRSLIPIQAYLNFLRKSLAEAEAKNPNAFHCKTPDCIAWVEIEGEIENFTCGACNRVNCVMCKAVHEGVSCVDYQDMIHGPGRRARENAATENQVRNLIETKNAQPCPQCGIIVQRIDGCRHMICTACKHDFQWNGI